MAHDRPDHLLIWITSGQGRILLDGCRSDFRPHTALFIPAGTLWSAELSRDCQGKALSVPASEPAALPDAPLHLQISDLQVQGRLDALFEALADEQNEEQVLWRRAMQSYGELLAIELRRQYRTAETSQPRPPAARRLCQAYCRRVAGQFAKNASMADHAAALNVTPTHLTRVCKAETGRTAAALLTERQLHAARTLLITTGLPMRDIAAELGFGSAAYFTRFITQHTGQTPSALRKSAKLETF
ncbi:AraC family transcriptional regulator [Roseobacteraceae bacterium NS-SX3]